MSFRLVFDPLSGRFELRPITTETVIGGGGTVLNGTIAIVQGSVFSVENDLNIGANGEILVEDNADLVIE